MIHMLIYLNHVPIHSILLRLLFLPTLATPTHVATLMPAPGSIVGANAVVGGVVPRWVAVMIGAGHAEVAVRGSSAVLATVLAIRAHLALRAMPHPPVLALTARAAVS